MIILAKNRKCIFIWSVRETECRVWSVSRIQGRIRVKRVGTTTTRKIRLNGRSPHSSGPSPFVFMFCPRRPQLDNLQDDYTCLPEPIDRNKIPSYYYVRYNKGTMIYYANVHRRDFGNQRTEFWLHAIAPIVLLSSAQTTSNSCIIYRLLSSIKLLKLHYQIPKLLS